MLFFFKNKSIYHRDFLKSVLVYLLWISFVFCYYFYREGNKLGISQNIYVYTSHKKMGEAFRRKLATSKKGLHLRRSNDSESSIEYGLE